MDPPRPVVHGASDSLKEISAGTLARLRRREVSALSEVYEAYGERIYSICRRLAGNRADAEDITQEVLLRSLDHAGSFSGRASFSTWLFRLTMNLARNHLKAERIRHSTKLLAFPGDEGPEDAAPGPAEKAMQREESAQLDALLQALPLDQRSVLILRQLEGMSYEAIADVLSIPLGTVNSRLGRGRQRLAELIGQSELEFSTGRDGSPRLGCPSKGSR